ncbi:TolB family protein [Desulforamulus ruminis]|uniref:Translation initiation factor beta propellor-like domain-containing protein n=1 Tax=Desulforamulus ruminis (strain ATCC 23193 / DSM 2154 / NCIMB 8452 / DL) TaxID=696281 RepID=F6DUI7_DESRL|nr:hypothetical protein [Desulforamulus ruminis]AEG59054.1 hypothetical protein Desru_0771 [Desulforamulus ruminis DSM 2154]
MKRLFVFMLGSLLILAISGCGTMKEKDQEVKVLPKEPKQELSVAGIEKLHEGYAQDVSPDGEILLFNWDEGIPDQEPYDEMSSPRTLHTLKLSDRSVAKMGNSEIHQGNAKYSPDTKNIAFLENIETFTQTYIMENKAGAAKKLIHKSDDIAVSVAWSPDGKQFAVPYFLANDAKIILYDAQGKEIKTVAQSKGTKINPYFFDNHTLLYASLNPTGPVTIMALDLNNESDPKEIVKGTNFAVSPNKRSIAYLSVNQDRSRWSIKVDAFNSDFKIGSTLSEISVKDGTAQMVWSPDSRYLVYSNGTDLWVLNPETGDKKQVVSNMSSILNILWAGNQDIIFSGIAKEMAEKDNHKIEMYRIKLS